MASARQHKLLEVGTRAPGFLLKRLEGGQASLQDLIATGPVLIAFFKVTCPVCQLTFPFLDRIHQNGAIPIYGISQNCPEDASEFAREFDVTFPILLDEEALDFPASNAYGISSVPTMFLIESDGVISHVFEGWNRQEMEWLGAKVGFNPIRPQDNVPAWKAG